MRYPPHLLDDIRARLPVSQVVARKVALKKKGREFAGLSPFKVEKTPSFFVNDQKGFYHCFASGEHGDIFSFVMKTEGLTFPEAIERLAAEAGVPLPKPSAADQGQDDRRQRLYALLEAAAKFFETALSGSAGREARVYLDKRGVGAEAVRSFRLGYAPASRSAIRDHLAGDGYTSDEMAAAGMLIAGEDIATPYDRFRHRVMFPIADLKGRVIAFGGRALDPEAPAKYLNSPETPLFHKGDNLYNARAARGVAHDTGRLIVVEGYMDVVALSEAGFRESVAPLGTALTEAQVKLLWRLAPEPILFFDGDSAGRKAAYRAVDVVLPLLQAGTSVRFAFLANGLDPDDLVRQHGPAAVGDVLDKARPLFEVLWSRELDLLPVETPEQKASFEKRMKALVATIADPAVRHHYDLELRQRLWSWSRGAARTPPDRSQTSSARLRTRPAQGVDWRSRARGHPLPRPPRGTPQNAPLAQPSASPELVGRTDPLPQRETLIVQAVLNHPWLLDDASEEFAAVELSSPALARLRQDILSAYGFDNSLDSPGLRSHLNQLGVGKVLDLVDRSLTHKCDRFAEIDAERSEVETGWRHTLELHDRQVGLRRSLEAAERAWHEERSEEAYARICELQGLLHQFGEAGDDGSTAVSG
ncbi:MAG: DNA primase [Hyphomicrobium sp.]